MAKRKLTTKTIRAIRREARGDLAGTHSADIVGMLQAVGVVGQSPPDENVVILASKKSAVVVSRDSEGGWLISHARVI